MSRTTGDENEIKDIALCYTALGLSVGDSPGKIEMVYKRVVETCKANLASPDPKVREEAKNSLSLVEEMYEKIRKSVTYQTALRDQDRQVRMQSDAGRSASSGHGTVVADKALTTCPMCHSVISKEARTCPRCKARIETVGEKMMSVVTTPAVLIIICILVLIGAAILVWMVFPEQIGALFSTASK